VPSNRRNGPNRQIPTRRPKVAGLRNRDTTYGETLQAEAREARLDAGEETASGDQGASREAAAAEAERSSGAAGGEKPSAGAEPSSGAAAGGADAEFSPAANEAEPSGTEFGEAGSSGDAEPSQSLGTTAEVKQPSTAAGAESEPSPSVEPVAAATTADRHGTFGHAAERHDAAGGGEGEDAGGGVAMMVRTDAGQPEASDRAPVWRGTWALWVATVVLAGLAVWFGVGWYGLRYSGPEANEALVSAGATSEVNGQITDAVEKVFSYDFNDTAKTETAARDLLVGPAVQRYNELFAVVKEQAPQQQLIVTTTVKNSAVTRLQGDRAELLLFVDQHAMRANTGESNTGPAQISVSAEKQGDRWKITQITLR
jgi:Mce-associated membrane protein